MVGSDGLLGEEPGEAVEGEGGAGHLGRPEDVSPGLGQGHLYDLDELPLFLEAASAALDLHRVRDLDVEHCHAVTAGADRREKRLDLPETVEGNVVAALLQHLQPRDLGQAEVLVDDAGAELQRYTLPHVLRICLEQTCRILSFVF